MSENIEQSFVRTNNSNFLEMEPIYLKTYQSGALQQKVDTAIAMLKDCMVCPRDCRVNRVKGKKGVCRTGRLAVVSSYNPHFGEEAPLVGTGGSGTIFFTNCNLLCIFCQNYDISHLSHGQEVTAKELAAVMIQLQEMRVENINLVTPTHVTPQFLEALPLAVERGLRLPIVYNSSGYDSVETLRLLDGVVDIYMPDIKFSSSEPAARYCNAPDYPEVAMAALREMHRQVGDLVLDERGVAFRGLIVRHLVMPDNIAGTRELMNFMAKEISKDTYVNVMAQYHPAGAANRFPELNRTITDSEYTKAIENTLQSGLHRLDQRRAKFFRWF